MDSKLTMLMILDGFGENPKEEGNAVKLANTPNLDKLMKKYPTTRIQASELAVRTSGRTNGKFRSWAYKYWCWKNSIPRTY